MKRYLIKISLFLIIALITISCEDYLNIPPEAELTEKEIFSTYENFQGFQDQLCRNLVDYNNHGWSVTMGLGGEELAPSGMSGYRANNGEYMGLVTGTRRSIWVTGNNNDMPHGGLYTEMWINIRLANLCLEKLESGLLTDATDEQRNWLKGQSLFFRAYYYYEYVRAFGPVPYIDEVMKAEEQNMKRHWSYEKNGKTYNDVQAVLERIVEDFDAAAALLPAYWPSPNINWGRATKLAALGFKAKALQYSASPLFNEQATGVSDYDKDLLDRCAVACQATIDLAVSLVGTQPPGMPVANADGLTEFSDMRDVFATWDGTQPGTPEVLFHRPVGVFGNQVVWHYMARNYAVNQLTWNKGAQASQNYIDKFEMKDGSRYQLAYDNDLSQAWENRDNRYDFCFYMHGDKVDTKTCDFSAKRMSATGQLNSNSVRKFQVDNLIQGNAGNATQATPLLRLADIYLTYAEAVYESTGSYSTIPAGLSLTAEDAVNKIRIRAGQPDVATTLPFYENNPLPGSCELASDPAFRLLYRNERAVELAFEGSHWFDIRRWKRATLKDGLQLQALKFDIDNKKKVIVSTINRIDHTTYVFKDQHYWLPFNPSLTRFSLDWEQNPGW